MVEKRNQQISNFLEKAGFAEAVRSKLSGDASFRKYERIKFSGKTYVLMDAPPDKENVKPFIKVDKFLDEEGFSAPKIIAEDASLGLLLLEDLGDNLFARVIEKNKSLEKELYFSAIDVLTKIRKIKPTIDLPKYDDELLLKESWLIIDWYAEKYKNLKISDSEKSNFKEILVSLFAKTRSFSEVTVLRDYHAENLIWLPEREGSKKVGLLDFQDAVIGSPAYDLVSLLEDARRDVSKEITEAAFSYYFEKNKDLDKEKFLDSYYILGAQRNIKIVGIFARLFIRDGKDIYLKYIPRVFKYLENDVSHPALSNLKKWLDKNIPKEIRT